MKHLLACTALFISGLCCHAQTNQATHFITLRQAIESALMNNRALQIERINPEIQRMILDESSGYYDPVFILDARRESATESGAFDPLNPGLESGYTAESDDVKSALGGFLPTGMRYDLTARYVASSGNRDFLNFDTYRLDGEIEVRQPLLKNFWIDGPRYLIKLSKGNVKISEAAARFVTMEIVNLVQQGYTDLVFAWEMVRGQQNLVKTRQDFLRSIERQVELGTMTVLDQRVAASQLAGVEVDLIESSNILALASNNLKTLMGTSATNWTQDFYVPVDRLIVVPETFDLVTSWQRGLTRRPDLLQREIGVELARLRLKYRYNQLFPALDVVASYGRHGANSAQAFPPEEPRARLSEAWGQIHGNDAPNDMIGLVLSFPLMRSAERARYKASQQLMRQAELQVKEHEELILREISDAIHTARFSYDRFHAARRATEFAELALQAEEEKLRGGKSSVNFVLELQADRADAYTTELEAKQAYNRALSQLQFAEGTILDAHKLVIDIE